MVATVLIISHHVHKVDVLVGAILVQQLLLLSIRVVSQGQDHGLAKLVKRLANVLCQRRQTPVVALHLLLGQVAVRKGVARVLPVQVKVWNAQPLC